MRHTHARLLAHRSLVHSAVTAAFFLIAYFASTYATSIMFLHPGVSSIRPREHVTSIQDIPVGDLCPRPNYLECRSF